jgi:hypothetical protein
MFGCPSKKALALGIAASLMIANVVCATTPVEEYFSTKIMEKLLISEKSEGGEQFAIKSNNQSLTTVSGSLWRSYEQTFGDEKVFISLPNIPAFTRINDTWGTTIALKDKVEYWLMAPVPAMPGVQKEQLFPMFIELHSKSPYKMIKSKVSEDNGLPVLEITSLNKRTNKMERTRVIISGENFYVTEMKYPKKKEGKIDTRVFLESVYVLK